MIIIGEHCHSSEHLLQGWGDKYSPNPVVSSLYCTVSQSYFTFHGYSAIHMCSWEKFQIGCVYLMDDAYPCAVLLAGALSVVVPSDCTLGGSPSRTL